MEQNCSRSVSLQLIRRLNTFFTSVVISRWLRSASTIQGDRLLTKVHFQRQRQIKELTNFSNRVFNVVLYKGNSVTLHMKSPSTIKYSICQIFTVSDTLFDARIVSLGENKRLKFGIRSQEPLKHRTYCWKSASRTQNLHQTLRIRSSTNNVNQTKRMTK